MATSPEAIAGLRRSNRPGSIGYLSRRLTRAKATETRLSEQLDAHRRYMARLQIDLADARKREAKSVIADVSPMPADVRQRVEDLLSPEGGDAA